MNRSWSRTLAAGACAAAALLTAVPAQATAPTSTPVSVSAVTRQDEYRVTLGRIYEPTRSEWTCESDSLGTTCEWVRYYSYVDLFAPIEIGAELWPRLEDFGRCLVEAAGLRVVASSVATGGVSLQTVADDIGIGTDVCETVTDGELAYATVDVYVSL